MSDVLELQQQVGNRAVSSLLRTPAEPSVKEERAAEPEKADAADTQYWDDVFVLARKRIAAKEFGEAEKLLLQVYKDPKFRSSDSPGIVLNLGLCLQERGDFTGAISLYQEALASSSWDEEARKEIIQHIRRARVGAGQTVGGR